MNTLSVKCPTCARPKDVACIKLAMIPGGRVAWTTTEPHRNRVPRG